MRRLPALILALAALTVAASPATAKDDDGRVIKRGDCSGASNWKLKAKPDDGGLEVEFEVDQNRNGVKWNVALRRNGKTVSRGIAHHPGAQRLVRVRAPDRQPGRHRHHLGGGLPAGETCRASLKI